jgi:dolichyl-phosphate-mannose--protein O-mannosyl transferase
MASFSAQKMKTAGSYEMSVTMCLADFLHYLPTFFYTDKRYLHLYVVLRALSSAVGIKTKLRGFDP